MDILSHDQQDILKRTRDTLGDLRDALGKSNASEEDRDALADSIRQLDELFLLVIAGEFNSGKSSFINALMGQDLQEVGVTPTTSHVHLLKYGKEVTSKPLEAGVWLHTAPVELLKNINIVDTPGTNAIVREHEAITVEFIPRSDLVLFVTSADRPFSESERNFLEQIKEWGKKIVLVINKVDIFDDAPNDRQKVLEFVNEQASALLGEKPKIFAVSARQATRAKLGEPRLWEQSGFEALENYIYNTLDDAGRFSLKLLNPLGVGQKLVSQELAGCDADIETLQEDVVLLDDIDSQMNVYDDDMQRNFKARLGEIDNILYEMEKRGNDFFDETLRLGRMPDLMRKDKIQNEFERTVVADTPQRIERQVGELIDWMVEQDLRQWTAVSDHLQTRRNQHAHRIVGDGGAQQGTLAYDRQRLVDSIGLATRQAVATYDKEKESAELAEAAREAVVNTGLLGAGGVGVGALVLLATSVAWVDVTGVLAGLTAVTFGLLVLPSRRKKAKTELAAKLQELRTKLVSALTTQFEREMKRGQGRIEDTIAPFSRFVRAEQEKVTVRRDSFTALDAHLVGLKSQLQAMENASES